MSRPWGRADQARLDGWLALAERGWRLFPVRPGSKVPAISAWSQRASDDPDRLSRFFRAHPNHNAGIACGPSGLLVVDCDVPKDDQAVERWRDGAEVFDDLAALHGGAPETWTVATPSGGSHLYYAAPDGRALGNTSQVLGPLLDTRGHGGQVVAPGSVLPAGGYELLDDTDPAPLPDWLATRLTPQPVTAAPVAAQALGHTVDRPLSARQASYVAAAVTAETERVRGAERGGHNTAIFTAANALGQLVGAGALARAEAEAAITAAAEHICTGPCDCTPREVADSIRSGLNRGTGNPRRLPDGPPTPSRTHAPGGDVMNQLQPDRTGAGPISVGRREQNADDAPAAARQAGTLGSDAKHADDPVAVEGDSVGQAVRRIAQTEPEDLDPVDHDSPISYQLTDTGLAATGSASPETDNDSYPTAESPTEHGLADDEVAVTVEAIARAELASRAAAASAENLVPTPRPDPDMADSARRASLARWHADDVAATETAGEVIDR